MIFKRIFLNDADVLEQIGQDDLWVIDKFILSKKLGYNCGPAGVVPPEKGKYIVRPCVNLRMMSAGAKFMELDKQDIIPNGYFWCEIFSGRHCSFDYNWGKQTLAVEGFREDANCLDRFSKWTKIQDVYELPDILKELSARYEWFNIETIGDNVIEAHFRFNDDFANHSANTIIPIWTDNFYNAPCGDLIGFLLQ